MAERKGSPPPGGDGEDALPDRIAPRSATTDAVRERLIDEAYRMITADGAGAVTVRKLAAAAGVSTMAVYTRFGSVGAVTGAVCERGFDEFAELMESVSRSDDPVADLQLLGLTYLAFATAHPHLYALMFQYTSPDWDAARRSDLMSAGWPTDSPAGWRAFAAMTRALERVGGADAGGAGGGARRGDAGRTPAAGRGDVERGARPGDALDRRAPAGRTRRSRGIAVGHPGRRTRRRPSGGAGFTRRGEAPAGCDRDGDQSWRPGTQRYMMARYGASASS